MKIRFSGRSYEYDPNSMSVGEARIIKKNTGYGLAQWGDELENGDPDALVALLYLAKKRSGEACKWSDFDDFQLNDLQIEASEGEETEEGEQPKAGQENPT